LGDGKRDICFGVKARISRLPYQFGGLLMSKNKKTISVSLDHDIVDKINQDHVNTSGLINTMLRKYIRGEIDL
jgi:uncharacterized protein (DUF4415 family)